MTEPTFTELAALRVPFPPEQIDQLPKGRVTLSYVGHAHVTARLLDVDPLWSWEPVAFGEDGLPRLDSNGGLWIRLTICGVTRLGYGHADGDKGLNATKEAIGDAIRNAAMRFGVALDLWAKDKPQSAPVQTKTSPEERKTYLVEIDSTDTVNELRDLYSRITARVSDETIREELQSRITKRAKGLEALEAKNARQSAAPETVNA